MNRLMGMSMILALLLVLVAACNGNRQGGSDERNLAGELDALTKNVQRQGFAFDGTASVRTDHFDGENIVQFRGAVDKNDEAYINLAIAPENGGMVEDMDLYARGTRLFMRFADEVEWKPVEERTPLIDDEVSRWNPLYHFRRIAQTGHQLQSVDSSGENVRGIRVILDSEELKRTFLQNLRDRLQRPPAEDGTARRFESKAYTGEGRDLLAQDLNRLREDLTAGLDEIEKSLEVQGDYLIYYDDRQHIPTRMVYTERIEYVEGGELNRSENEVEIYFRDFGTKVNLPDTIGID